MISLFDLLPWVILLLLGVGYLLAQPRWLLRLAARVKPGALYALTIPKAPPMVALTIDDGPSAATADILAVLARYEAKATFFNISDHLPGYEEVVMAAIAAQHELGNHLTADESSIRLSPQAFEASLLAAEKVWQPYWLSAPSFNLSSDWQNLSSDQQNLAQNLVQSVTADADVKSPAKAPIRWLRPGMGWYSASMIATATRYGYRLALGSVFPYDTHVPFSRFASAFILSRVKSGDIIVLHDGDGRGQRTRLTLETILPVLKARGYRITTLSELTSELAADCLD